MNSKKAEMEKKNYICISTQKLAEILNARWFQICYYRYQVNDVTIYKFSKYTVSFKLKEMCALTQTISFYKELI